MVKLPFDLSQESVDALHPAFIEAVTRLMSLDNRPSDAPEVLECLATAILHAPKALQENLVAEYQKQGILPKPEFYTNKEEGLHSIEKAARYTGLSEETIKAELEKLREDYPDAVLSDEARKNAQRVQ